MHETSSCVQPKICCSLYLGGAGGVPGKAYSLQGEDPGRDSSLGHMGRYGKRQCCGSGSGRIRNYLQDPKILISDPTSFQFFVNKIA